MIPKAPPVIPNVKSPQMIPRSPNAIPSPNSQHNYRFSYSHIPSPRADVPHFMTTSQQMNISPSRRCQGRSSATDRYAGNSYSREGSHDIEERSSLRERVLELEAEALIASDYLKRLQTKSKHDSDDKFEMNTEISRLKAQVVALNNQNMKSYETKLQHDEMVQKIQILEKEKEISSNNISTLLNKLADAETDRNSIKGLKEQLDMSTMEILDLKTEIEQNHKNISLLSRENNEVKKSLQQLKSHSSSELNDAKIQINHINEEIEELKEIKRSQNEEICLLRQSNQTLSIEIKHLKEHANMLRDKKLLQLINLVLHKRKLKAFHVLFTCANLRFHKKEMGTVVDTHVRKNKILFQLWFKIVIREKIRKRWLKWLHTDIHVKNRLHVIKTEEILNNTHFLNLSTHKTTHEYNLKEISYKYDQDIQLLYNKVNEYRDNELKLRHKIASSVSAFQDMEERLKSQQKECGELQAHAVWCQTEKESMELEYKKLNIVLNQTLIKLKEWGLDPKLLLQENIVTDLIVEKDRNPQPPRRAQIHKESPVTHLFKKKVVFQEHEKPSQAFTPRPPASPMNREGIKKIVHF